MSRYGGRITVSTIGTVMNEHGQVLLIQRAKEPFIGAWAMPGGKIELGEHPDGAMIREFYEETGLRTKIVRYCGTASEVLVEGDDVSHFILHVFALEIVGGTLNERPTDEGPLEWIPVMDLKGKMIPSDEWMIEHMVLKEDGPKLITLQSSETGFELAGIYR